jgi:CBS-domain-containing membrane protein
MEGRMLNIDRNADQTIALRIRTRRTLLGNGEVEVKSSLACARKAQEVSLATCTACEHCNALMSTRAGRAAHVFCHDPEKAAGEVLHFPTRMQTPADGARQSVADYTPVSAVMSADVTCVRADVSVDDLTTLLLEREISGVPVVDAAGAPVGVVSKTDLVRDGYENGDMEELDQASLRDLGAGFHESSMAGRTVADIMLGMTFALPEDATLSQACALMAYEGVHRLPVTSPEGKVVGILSALDVLRWIAQRDGYIVRR